MEEEEGSDSSNQTNGLGAPAFLEAPIMELSRYRLHDSELLHVMANLLCPTPYILHL